MSEPSSVYTISKRKILFLGLIVLTMAALNVALIIQNRTLKASSQNVGGSRSIVLKAGKALPALTGMDIEGRNLTFDYGADPRKTVLLVFSPHCVYCKKNMSNWKALVQGLDPKSFRVVAVSTLSEEVKEYVEQYGLGGVPVIATPDPQNRVAYEMNMTPQTVLIGADGKAEKVWTGLIRGADRDEIEQSLSVNLPAAVE